MTLEEWCAVEGFPRYEVSDLGRVRRTTGKILKPADNGRGYLHVDLYATVGAKPTRLYVHRLVAAAFLPDEGKPQVNHKDGDVGNNRAENLEWATNSSNHLHAYRELGRKPNVLPGRPVIVGGVRYVSLAAAGKALGTPGSTICNALREGRRYKGMEVTPDGPSA